MSQYRVMIKKNGQYLSTTVTGANDVRARAMSQLNVGTIESWRVCSLQDLTEAESDALLYHSFTGKKLVKGDPSTMYQFEARFGNEADWYAISLTRLERKMGDLIDCFYAMFASKPIVKVGDLEYRRLVVDVNPARQESIKAQVSAPDLAGNWPDYDEVLRLHYGD